MATTVQHQHSILNIQQTIELQKPECDTEELFALTQNTDAMKSFHI